MQIKEIYIQNFKGFEKKSFSFNPKFNVAIGNNATGKSTLLHSIQVALGGYLQCLDIPASRNYRRQFKGGEAYVKWNDMEKGYVKNPEQTLITTTAKFSNVESTTKWTRIMLKNNTTSHNQKDAGPLINTIADLLSKRSKQPILTPIVASFGTERLAKQLRKGKKAQSKRTRFEKGFLASLSENVDFDGVLEWIYNYDKELNYGKEFEGNKEAFYDALHQALPYLKHIDFNRQENEFEAEVIIDKHTIGKTLHSNMSDGLKAMLNLVAEIAFRCVILNGFKGINAVVDTEGVVLIDELDMHLHPNWQMRIVDDLRTAFPKIQFIVTTHSPFIVQSLIKDELINLDELHIELMPNDQTLNKVATDIMGVRNINSDDFEKRHDLSLKVLQELGRKSGEIGQSDYVRLKEIVDGILVTDTSDPVYKAYLEVKKTQKA